MKTKKLTENQKEQVATALTLHRWHRKEYKDVLSAGAFVYVSNMVLAARKVLHSKNAMPEVAAELAKPITRIDNCYHIPTRGWEIGNGLTPVTEFN